jgi:HdeA/HdeB family
MNRKIAALMLLGLLGACAQPQAAAPPAPPPSPPPAPVPAPSAAPAPADRYVTIQSATCEAYLALADDDRADASMFYIGYTARRFGSSVVNVGKISSIEGLAANLCGINPSRTVASAFARAYLETRRW